MRPVCSASLARAAAARAHGAGAVGGAAARHAVDGGGTTKGRGAALATRMLAVADGSDMMGALRNPAGGDARRPEARVGTRRVKTKHLPL